MDVAPLSLGTPLPSGPIVPVSLWDSNSYVIWSSDIELNFIKRRRYKGGSLGKQPCIQSSEFGLWILKWIKFLCPWARLLSILSRLLPCSIWSRCQWTEQTAKPLHELCTQEGVLLVLATSPVFPSRLTSDTFSTIPICSRWNEWTCPLILPCLNYNQNVYSADDCSLVISINLGHIYSAIPTIPKFKATMVHSPSRASMAVLDTVDLHGALLYMFFTFLWSPGLGRAHSAHGHGRSTRGQVQTHKAQGRG